MIEDKECIDCAHVRVQACPKAALYAYCEKDSMTFPKKCNLYQYEPGADKEELKQLVFQNPHRILKRDN